MKRILSLLLTFVCVIGFIYGCASVSSSSESITPEPADRSASDTVQTILLCLPRDGEDHTLLRNAFTKQAQSLGYQAVISESDADSEMTDEQLWDIDQLQVNARAVIVYNCDGVEEGLIKKWSDAGVTLLAAGKRLDAQAQIDGTRITRQIKANPAYADGALSRTIATHISDTLSAKKTSAGFVALFGDSDAQLEFLNFVKADLALTNTKYTANAPFFATTDPAAALAEVKAAKAIVYAGAAPAAWVDAAPKNTLMGVCSADPAALQQAKAGQLDFIAFNDPIELMQTSVNTAHTLLTGGTPADWSLTVKTVLLRPGDPAIDTYLSYAN